MVFEWNEEYANVRLYHDVNDEKPYEIIEIEDLIAAYYDRLKSKWIPCSERMPKEGECVIASDEDGAVILACWYKGKWFSDDGAQITHIQEMPDAWMPLPEPWKGEING